MLTVHTPVDEAEATLARPVVEVDGYGYGWYLGRLGGGPKMIFHTGGNAGFVTVNAWFPDEDLRVVILANDESVDLLAVASSSSGSPSRADRGPDRAWTALGGPRLTAVGERL